MGVAETVRSLAETVASAKQPIQPRHQLLVELLRLLPLYRDITGLCAWESAFQGALEEQDDESELGQILWAIFEFGRFNMYAAFDAAGTREEYDSLVSWLSERGVMAPAGAQLDGW